METKLTLRIDDEVIRKAKKLAKVRGTSVSRMVADYIAALETDTKPAEALPPVTATLWGSLSQTVSEKDYRDYLEDKFL
jgi:hypothetical protein